jgi:hypothetical protein
MDGADFTAVKVNLARSMAVISMGDSPRRF